MAQTTPNREEVLETYATHGASAAATKAGVSTRTVQRWAAAEGIKSGWEPPILRGHGTSACYIRGCRKPECVEANKQTNREVKERRVARYEAGTVKVKHGVSAYSNWNCRCAECKAAWSAYLRDRRMSRA